MDEKKRNYSQSFVPILSLCKIIGKIVERIDKGTLKRAIAPSDQITEHITVKRGKNTPVNLLKERNKTPKTTMITRGT